MMNKRLFSVLLWSSLVVSRVMAADDDDDEKPSGNWECDIKCHDNTTCVPGDADFSKHPHPDGQPLDIHIPTISPGGWHCDCPDGKTGLRCGRTYIGCENENHKCYHGGKCIPGITDRFGNDQEFCDCTEAVGRTGIKHVGKYCEIPVPDPCVDDDSLFCVNGYCRQNAETHHHPCNCLEGYDGFHCEFKKGSVPDCNMTCDNGGTCQLGYKSFDQAMEEYQDYWKDTSTTDLMHCVCPKGFFGNKCEVSSTTCNEKHCFNGGTCKQVAQEDGTVDEHCDCSTARGPEGTSRSFSGKYCQYEATKFCTDVKTEDGKGVFCVNGGTCKTDGSLGCECKDGFSGPICEFADKEKKCQLQCDNGGICRKGTKDYTHLVDLGVDLGALTNVTTTHTSNFEHCACPLGYTGLTCEVKMETCGEGEHLCLHGSTCVPSDGKFSCDCDAAFSGLHQFAGEYCQHKSTSICTPDGKPGSSNSFAFCVNNGKCRGKGEDHTGCDCADGFEGQHCEIRSDAADQITTNANRGSSDGGPRGWVIFIIVFACLAAAVAAFVFHRKLSNQKEDIEEPIEAVAANGSHTAGPVLDMGKDKDIDGNELENVEII